MNLPYIEPPYALPGADTVSPTAIGPWAVAGSIEGIAALKVHADQNQAITTHQDGQQTHQAPSDPNEQSAENATVIEQTDTLVQAPHPANNPFESLIEHQLHIHLPQNTADS